MKGRGHVENPNIDGKIEWILKKQGEKVQTRFIWLRTWATGGLL